MKKTVLLMSAMAMSWGTFAQKAINTAKEYLRDDEFAKAQQTIDEALKTETYKSNPDAWFARGEIFEKWAEKDKTNTNLLEEAFNSYMKVLEVKPDFTADKIDPKLLRAVNIANNAGTLSYNKGDYAAAAKNFKIVSDVHDLNGGKHFKNKQFDTLTAQAVKFQGISNLNQKKYDEALAIFLKAKENPISREVYVYTVLIDIYTEKKDDANVEKTLQEARALFPKDNEITRQEINYYSRTGKTDLLVKKLEDAIAKDPDNSVLHYNLAILYANLANPVDPKTSKPMTPPANAEELIKKSETAYKMAIDADPTKPDYYYNLGALFFNKASEIGERMNAITGTTAEDDRKYEALRVQRSEQFTKALPHFQKAYDLLAAQPEAKRDNDTYRNTMIALQNIYSVMGQQEKADDITSKLDAMKK
jgi:tetratricopeptide (TPR) repeat protein